MIRRLPVHAALIFLLLALAAVLPAAAQVQQVEVSITNLTRGQIISPPVVISHSDGYQLFELGQAASAELAALAEDGDTAPLAAQLATLPEVFDFGFAADGIGPGATMTVVIEAAKYARYVTVAGMLISSNDAFFAVNGLQLAGGSVTTTAVAYDSGSEGNAELCDHIPGPPCDNPFVPNLDGAEGFVHVHAGIQGIGDLSTADFDWRNPVALIEMRPAP